MFCYNPTTGELIQTNTPADWMGVTELQPPKLNPQTQSCMFRDGRWWIEDAIEAKFVPPQVSMRQARLALLEQGLLNKVQSAIDAISDDVQRQRAQIEWEFATTVDRNSELVGMLAQGLSLNSQQLDDLFIAAHSK